ncbi:MAG: type II toxin-antitoxin system YafQ family toxin [Candidatus Pacebacteria bacterium]|nr:type II toxin-antitoxin system YafQ family toxin [Candidatus Paceibacterota bacterium]
MFCLKYSNRFKKDLKYYKYKDEVLIEFKKVLDILIGGDCFPEKNCNHSLKGEFKDCFECHVKPDIILIYKIEDSIVLLLRIGSHSDIF